MPIVLPRMVREKWGEEVADQFATCLEVVLSERAIGRDECREQMQEIFSWVFPPEQTENLMDVFARLDPGSAGADRDTAT